MRKPTVGLKTALRIQRRGRMRQKQAARFEIERLIERSADPFYVLDRQWCYTYVNLKTEQIVGQPREKLLGKNIWEMSPSKVGTLIYEQMYRAVEAQASQTFEMLSDELSTWVEVNLYPSSNGLVVHIRDISERKRIERAVLVSQEQADLNRQQVIDIFESISDAFVGLDQEYRFTYLNSQATDMYLRLTGQSPEYFIGKVIWEAFPGSYESPFGKLYRQVLTEKASGHLQEFFPTLNTWFDVRVYPSRDGLSIYFADVTERYHAQAALTEAQARLRSMLDSAKDYAIFSVDVNGGITSWNTGAERIFGYAEGEVLGQNSRILYSREDRADGVPEHEIQSALELGYSENERWYVCKDGHQIYGSGTARPLRDGTSTLQGFTKIIRDTTEQMLTAQRTQLLQHLASDLSAKLTAHDMAKSIIQASLNAVGSSMASIFLLRNDQTLERLSTQGYSQTTQNQFPRFPLDYSTPITDSVREWEIVWIATQDEYFVRYPHLRNDIARLSLQSTICLPLMLEDRILGGIAISFEYPKQLSLEEQDLLIAVAHLCAQALERARLYEVEMEARQVAEKASLLKMQFLAMISHELRTPLASIKGFTTTLLAEDVAFSAERQRMFLTVVNQETDKLTDLVEQLLDLSRLQAGALRIDPIPHSLDSLFDTARIQLKTLTETHQLVIHRPGHPIRVLVDLQRVAQVLVNLVGNAAKFSARGTQITIDASQVDDKLQIDVTDEGVGIPIEDRTEVFEAFRQIERKTPNQRKGLGLGLAICKGIIEAHKGHIWIQDRPIGTTISLTLPMAQEDTHD